jgi:hypothetical protein
MLRLPLAQSGINNDPQVRGAGVAGRAWHARVETAAPFILAGLTVRPIHLLKTSANPNEVKTSDREMRR